MNALQKRLKTLASNALKNNSPIPREVIAFGNMLDNMTVAEAEKVALPRKNCPCNDPGGVENLATTRGYCMLCATLLRYDCA